MEVWTGTAKLRWFAGGELVGEERLAYGVECRRLPEDDRLPVDELPRLETLRLLCAKARREYGVPPRTLDIRLDGDELLTGTMARARWHHGSGDFCHGMGIMRVGSPHPDSRLVDLCKLD